MKNTISTGYLAMSADESVGISTFFPSLDGEPSDRHDQWNRSDQRVSNASRKSFAEPRI
jgi:hypothetical protein